MNAKYNKYHFLVSHDDYKINKSISSGTKNSNKNSNNEHQKKYMQKNNYIKIDLNKYNFLIIKKKKLIIIIIQINFIKII